MQEDYEKCVDCNHDLLEGHIDLDVGVVYGLLFCPNKDCPRYLLFTNTPLTAPTGEKE